MRSRVSLILLLIVALFGSGFWTLSGVQDDALSERSVEFEEELESGDLDLEFETDAVASVTAATLFFCRQSAHGAEIAGPYLRDCIREHATRGPPEGGCC